MSDSVDLEVIHCHPNPETRQGLLSRHVLSAYLAPLSSSESYGGSLTSNGQHPIASICRPTRFPTRTLYHLCFTTTDEWYRDKVWTKGNLHIVQSVSLLTRRRNSIQLITPLLLSKIVRSTLPEADLSMAVKLVKRQTISRGIQPTAMIVHIGVPKRSKMSPTLFSFYLADMSRPTEPVKRICYADDITVWASGVKIPELEHKINGYLTEMSCFLRDNSLFIYAPKSTVTLFTQDTKQVNTHPKIKISDRELPLVRNTKLLGVYLDTFFSFNTVCVQPDQQSQ